MKAMLYTRYGLYEKDGQPFCDSLQVAETFGKQHAHILRDIERKLSDFNNANQSKFGEINFIKTWYKDDKNRRQPKYLLTRDGFTFLVTSYNGKKATEFKIAYIQRFNDMERFILEIQNAKLDFPAFTNAVMEAHAEPKFYHFSTEINMIYKIVLGMTAKQFREVNGIDSGEDIKSYMTEEQLRYIHELQMKDIGLLITTNELKQRRDILEKQYKPIEGRKGVYGAERERSIQR